MRHAGLGTLDLQVFEDTGYGLLSIEPAHVLAVGNLKPWPRDSFDRLLVAQAVIEHLRRLTFDDAPAPHSELAAVV